MSENTCRKCRYWHKATARQGECRRNPPKTTPRVTSEGDAAAWVITGPDDWCGEFSEVPEKKVPIPQEAATQNVQQPRTTCLPNATCLLTEEETAKYIGMSRIYLRRARMDGTVGKRTAAPPYIKIGRSVRYHLDDLIKWIDEHRRW